MGQSPAAQFLTKRMTHTDLIARSALTTRPLRIRSWLGVSCAVLLAACGGGGDSDSTPPPAPPTIATQPSGTVVTAPAAATFSVTAGETGTLSYQWRRNGAAIAGATSASYSTPATVPADNGTVFTVVVSNATGSVESVAATQSVLPPAPGALANKSIVSGGVARGYLEYTPTAMPTAAVPLVIVLHGGSNDAATAASAARYQRMA
jgi:hypothetical protein